MKHPLLAGLAAFGWRTGTLLLALAAAAVMTFGTPAALKSALGGSGAYQAAAGRLAARATEAVSTKAGQTADTKAIETAAKDNITAGSLQKAAEQNIDNTYDWLEGKAEKPDIKLDLSPYINGFTQQLGDQALQRTKGLPVCTVEQLRQLNPSKLDVTSLPCQPPGINLDSAKDQAIANATASNDFLSNPVITTDSLPKDAQGKTAIDRAAKLPDAYTWAMRAPWIFGILALLSAVALALLVRPDWRYAVRRLGRSLFFTGVALAALAIAAKFLLAYLADPANGKASADEFRGIALSFISSIEKAFGGKLLWFAIIYGVIGGLAWLAVRLIKRPDPAAEAAAPVMAPPEPKPTSAPVEKTADTRPGGDYTAV